MTAVDTLEEVAKDAIIIPQLEAKRLKVTIQGTSPLICHRFGDAAVAGIEEKQQKKGRVAKEARDPEVDGREALYLLRDSVDHRFTAPLKELRCGFPGVGLKKAIVTGGMRGTDAKGTELRAALTIDEDLIEIHSKEGPYIRTDHVVIARQTGSVAYRPCFEAWEMTFTLGVLTSILSVAEALTAVQAAGFSIGIGDWRSEKSGTFGAFTLVGAEEI